MESIDWDIYAKSYEDTQHLLGRADLAQKHYEMIGKSQNRDCTFNSILVHCLYPDVQSIESARQDYLQAPSSYPIRSRSALKTYLASYPTLVGVLPQASDYLLEPAIDSFLFQIQLSQQKLELTQALEELVQEVTNELLADLSVERKTLARVIPHIETTHGAPAVPSRRDGLVRVAQKSPYVVRVEAVIPVIQGAAYLVLGYVFDPEHQWSGLELKTPGKSYNVFPLVKRFVWHEKAQKLLELGVPGDYLDPDVGFAILVSAENLVGEPERIQCLFKDADPVLMQPATKPLAEIDASIIPTLWSLFHSDLFDYTKGRLELLDPAFVHNPAPRQSSQTQFRLRADKVLKLERNLLVFGQLFDSQQDLKALYLRVASGRCVRLDTSLVKTPRPELLESASQLGVADELMGFCAYVEGVFVDDQSDCELLALLDSGEWVVDTTPPEPAHPQKTRALLLDQWDLSLQDHSRSMLERVVEPVFPQLAQARRAQTHRAKPTFTQFGVPLASPEYSLLVYCSGQGDELKFLLSSLTAECDAKDLEVILVADFQCAARIEKSLKYFSALLNLPILLVAQHVQQEYAAVLNTAVEHCKGRYLCLLNSQLMPAQSGWLAKMAGLFKSRPDVGLVGCRLLDVDDMVLSIGLRFIPEKQPVSMWASEFPARGLPSAALNLPETFEMPAVPTDCIVMQRAFFQGLSGFDESFSAGRLEATDLCLRVWKAERKVIVHNAVAMYHLSNVHLTDIDHSQTVQKDMLANRRLQHIRWSRFIDQRFRNWEAGVTSGSTFVELNDTVKNLMGGLV